MTSTNSGEANSELSGIDSAADAFLASFKLPADAENQPSDEETRKKPSEEQPEPEQTEEGSDASPEQTEEGAEEGETEKAPKRKYAEEDAYAKVKVGDQELEVSVKDLKRLHGQEAALTRRSQEVAAERKATQDKALQ